jgi:hypothetical protein
MIGLKNRYCLFFFKAILVAVGLIFLVAQSSFKFYRFASFPICGLVTKVISHKSISGGSSDFLKYDKQVKINPFLDKRYDLKNLFSPPAPDFQLAALPVEIYKQAYSLPVVFSTGMSRVISMRGPPSH